MPFKDPEKKKQYQKNYMTKNREEKALKAQTELERVFTEFQGLNLWDEPKNNQKDLANTEIILDGDWLEYFKDSKRP